MGARLTRNVIVFEWLARAKDERLLKGGDRRYDLLEYLVREVLEGRGETIKAYAIALDVLGRSEDFDPATDSIVRVEIARLRDALELYYALSDDPHEPRISIPKGSYQPAIEWPESPPVPQHGPVTHRRVRPSVLAIAGLALGAVVIAGAAYLLGFEHRHAPGQSDLPIVEVAPVAVPDDFSGRNFAFGFRQKLMADLAHLPTVVVRDGPLKPDHLRSVAVAAPDYRLSITPAIEGQSGIIGLQLTAVANETIVWSRAIPLADGALDFYTSLTQTVQGLGEEIAGSLGAIPTDQAALVNGESDSRRDYRCLIVSLVFDATKDTEAGEQSRDCLDDVVERGTRNSTLLASHALNLFFQSAELTGPASREMLQEAHRHARDATEANPNDAYAQEILGNVLSALGQRSEAIERYERSVQLAPSRPAPHFLLGWQQVLQGDWENGMQTVQSGINMQPIVPGYMVVPLALDAFRRGEYAESLKHSVAVIDRGDPRGYSLAFAASFALGDTERATEYFLHPDARTSHHPMDPMREVRVTFSNPDVMTRYQEVIEPYLNGRKNH